MCLILNGHRDAAVWMYKYEDAVNGNEERELLTVNFTFNINLMFKQQICYSPQQMFPKILPPTSVHFVTRVWRSRAARLSPSSRFFTQPATYKMATSNSSAVSTFIL